MQGAMLVSSSVKWHGGFEPDLLVRIGGKVQTGTQELAPTDGLGDAISSMTPARITTTYMLDRPIPAHPGLDTPSCKRPGVCQALQALQPS